MFDEVFEIVQRCTNAFRSSVRDAFGASIVVEVLDPIRNELGMLCLLHEDLERHSVAVRSILQDARSMTLVVDSEE